MYRLVIVDDEYEIRMGLSNYVPWDEMGFLVVGVFGDAASALKYLETDQIDVLLTDIRMPIMDGLELIREVKKVSPATICLILSGYKDFEYAREGIALGVRQFIVKPTKYSQLSEIFSTLKKELDGTAYRLERIPNLSSDNHDTLQQALIIEAVKSYVQKNLKTANLDGAALVAKLNPNYLSTFFHVHSGVRFGDYVAMCRIEEACRLLVETSMRINEIAYEIGYTNPTSFSRAFKISQGISPKQWRILYGLGR